MVSREMRVLMCHRTVAFDSGIVMMHGVWVIAGGQRADLFEAPIRRRMRCRQTGAHQWHQRGHQQTGKHRDQA